MYRMVFSKFRRKNHPNNPIGIWVGAVSKGFFKRLLGRVFTEHNWKKPQLKCFYTPKLLLESRNEPRHRLLFITA